MATTTITSRTLGRTFRFFVQDRGGYVYLVTDRRPGTTGQQICAGGGFHGDCVMSSPATLEHDTRRWYRAHLRAEQYPYGREGR